MFWFLPNKFQEKFPRLLHTLFLRKGSKSAHIYVQSNWIRGTLGSFEKFLSFPMWVLLFYMSECGCKTKKCDESLQDFSGKENQCIREETIVFYRTSIFPWKQFKTCVQIFEIIRTFLSLFRNINFVKI